MAALSVSNYVSRTVPGGPFAPFPDQRPAVEQGPGHGEGVEPLPITGGFAPLQVDRDQRRVYMAQRRSGRVPVRVIPGIPLPLALPFG